MEAAIKAIQGTPVPTLLIVAGLFFLLLGFVSKLGGMIEVSPEQKKYTLPIGLLVLTIGLVIHFTPPNTSNTLPSPSIAITPTPQTGDTPAQTAKTSATKSNELAAVINDPEGYTNIRAGKGSQFGIIARVNAGEVFYTTPQQSTDWWPVRTQANQYGYMHRSRITLNN